MRFGEGISSCLLAAVLLASPAVAQDLPTCSAQGMPSHQELRNALQGVLGANGGFNLPMWASIVNRRGEVCTVTRSGGRGDQWPGSRVISAQKANTANAFSLPGLALSTANLYTAVQPGGSLFGLQESNPVDATVAYAGNPNAYGGPNDPLVGQKVGGVNVFGGGLALYNDHGTLIGAIGVSGDSSCADHVIAWKVRNALNLDHVPNGVSGDPARPDNIVYDINSPMPSGWGHPHCLPSDIDPATLPTAP